jgi:hypothetical protein
MSNGSTATLIAQLRSPVGASAPVVGHADNGGLGSTVELKADGTPTPIAESDRQFEC